MFSPCLFLQQREKASKDARRARLTAEHKELMSIVAFKMSIDRTVVEEAVINSEKVPISSIYSL